MNDINTLNNKQISLVKQFKKLIKEMKDEDIICFNEKSLDHYDGDIPSYTNDKIYFINGKNIETISVLNDTDVTDDMVIPCVNTLTSVDNFIQVTNTDNPLDDYTIVACTVKD